MDLTTTPTPTPTPTKSADSENDTPPHVQPINSLPFTNGTLKNYQHLHHHHQPPPPPPPPAVVTYKECLKNHAASIGRHAVDGCGEFMPSSTATAADPTSLKCAACGCHRSFHRREPDDSYSSPTPISTNTPTTHFLDFQRHNPQSRRFSPSSSPPPPLQPHMLLALSTAADDHHHHRLPSPVTPTAGKGENSRKRFRTKFTQNQKEKMLCFAEKLNWKMPKSDESAGVEEFCNDIGVTRGVLKVWIHNNKHTIGKKDSNNNNSNITNGIINFQNNGYNDVDKNGDNSNNGGVHLHVSANGSSPSSS